MREIKFRAWTYWKHAIDNKKYKMIYSGDITEKGSGRVLNFPFEIDGEFVLDIMQYTGFKDKNDKEIYEGDILKCKLYNGKHENYIVLWDKKEGMFTSLNEGKTNFIDCTIWNKFEVIGNIYENSKV